MNRKLKTLLACLCLLALPAYLSGCSGADILNLTITRAGYTVHKDLAYGKEPRQALDIYVPATIDKDRCTVLFFYGGSWQTGDKAKYLFTGQAFSSLGCVTVIADYRRYPQVSYPVFIEDGAAALAFVHKHIAEYGGSASNIYLAGHSAGAYNAVMLAAQTRFVTNAGGKQDWIRGVIGLAGPYDFLPFTDPNVKALFSTAKDADTQPINYVHKGMPRIFLASGDEDTEVLPENSRRLAAKLKKYGNNVTFNIYPGNGHVGIILSLAQGFRSRAPLLRDIGQFIHDGK